MKMSLFHPISLLTLIAAAAFVLPAPANPPAAEAATVSPENALRRLKDGNSRYVKYNFSQVKPNRKRRLEVAKGQHPFAVIVGCSDSRVGPEIVFDQSLGDLFVVRTAGNLVDDYALGSIEYAVAHLGTRLVVVLGHERCGAVDAALQKAPDGGHVKSLVEAITPAVERINGRPGDPLENAVKENAADVAKKIRDSQPALSSLAKADVRVVEGYYDLDTGVVQFAK